MTSLPQNWVGNDISVQDLPANSMEALGNRHNCARTGLAKFKMTSLCQNWLGEVEKT